MLLPIASTYPEQMEIIGQLLVGYSELEVGLMHAVMEARQEFDQPFKAMYRIRGEDQRIRVADGLARHHFLELNENLGNQFAIAISAMQHCRQIRNQFAHCQWWGDSSGYVKFVALEDEASENSKFKNFQSLNLRRIDLALLQAQKSYFEYVQDMFLWIVYETYVLRGKSNQSPYPLPKPREKPDLYTR